MSAEYEDDYEALIAQWHSESIAAYLNQALQDYPAAGNPLPREAVEQLIRNSVIHGARIERDRPAPVFLGPFGPAMPIIFELAKVNPALFLTHTVALLRAVLSYIPFNKLDAILQPFEREAEQFRGARYLKSFAHACRELAYVSQRHTFYDYE